MHQSNDDLIRDFEKAVDMMVHRRGDAYAVEFYETTKSALGDRLLLIAKLIEALERLVASYSGFEDGDGNPCPDVAFARDTLSAVAGLSRAETAFQQETPQ